MTISTRDLKVFRTVAAVGSVSGAAGELNCVQSNVTGRVRQLERQLQTPLFYRKARGMALAPGGRVLLDYADKVLRLLAEAEKAVRESGEQSGELKIGSMETTAAVRLPGVLAAYHEQLPEVDITLATGPTQDLVERVLAYELDGAFVGGVIRHPDLDCQAVFDEELVLVTEPACAGPDDIGKRVLLVFRQGCSYRARAEAWMRESGLLPVRLMEFGTAEAILGCVMAGMGVTLLPRAFVARPGHEGAVAIHSLPPKTARLPTSFVRRKDTLVTRAMTRLLELVREPRDGAAAAE